MDLLLRRPCQLASTKATSPPSFRLDAAVAVVAAVDVAAAALVDLVVQAALLARLAPAEHHAVSRRVRALVAQAQAPALLRHPFRPPSRPARLTPPASTPSKASKPGPIPSSRATSVVAVDAVAVAPVDPADPERVAQALVAQRLPVALVAQAQAAQAQAALDADRALVAVAAVASDSRP
jgi:hypothetical protein